MVPCLWSFEKLVFVGVALIIFMNNLIQRSDWLPCKNLASNKRFESIWSALLALFNKPGNYIGMCTRVQFVCTQVLNNLEQETKKCLTCTLAVLKTRHWKMFWCIGTFEQSLESAQSVHLFKKQDVY